jgi:outer membrane lipoprotein carrier protein
MVEAAEYGRRRAPGRVSSLFARACAAAPLALFALGPVALAPVEVASAAAPASPGAAPASASANVGANTASDAQALARVERSLAALDSVRAEFVQELVDPRTKTTQRATGTLTLKKPGKFRWDYAQPAQVIVSDGDRLWLYDEDLEQVTVRRVKDTLSQTPAMLLSGNARIGDGFVVRAAPSSGGLDWVRLLPKRADTDFRELRLGFAGDTLRRMEFEDKLNQLTRIDLRKVERNVKIDDAQFRFVPPQGTDVIGPGT